MLNARVEFKLQDSWVGVFWRRSTAEEVEVTEDKMEAVMVTTPRLDVWVCFVPWFPLHVVWLGRESRSDAMTYIADRNYDEIAKEMPHDSECVDCGEHNPTYECDSCKAPLCGVCWNAGDGYCEDCEWAWRDDDDYCECEEE